MSGKASYLIVMAGGSGTRFWPKSTSRRPKQLLSFSGENGPTLLTQTLSRFDGIVPAGNRVVVTTQALSQAVSADSPGAQVLAEPQGRNTAPCVYWAARWVAERDPRGVMLVMPSDHCIANLSAFQSAIRTAIAHAAAHDDLVTLGVKPSHPETGYGYLKTAGSGECRKVEAFVEKPNAAKAQEFLKAGNYFWNGGIFIWRADVILKVFDEFMPEMKREWDKAGGKAEAAYGKLTATSIDYGVMEKARNVVMFPLDCGWDDLGSWVAPGIVTSGEVVAVDSKGNVIDAPGKLVALLGVDDLIVSQHGDAILVARKDRAQDIRLIVEQVKKKRPELA